MIYELRFRRAIGCFVFFWAAVCTFAEIPVQDEALIWESAAAHRAASFFMAPTRLLYEQYQLNGDGGVSHRENGLMSLSYNENGKADISVSWAQRDGKDFTGERARRLEKQSARRNEYLSFTTPFDPDVQSKLERRPGKKIYYEGIVLWQYEFQLPVHDDLSIVGTARVREDDRKPYDFRYTVDPLPWFLDIIEIHIFFDTEAEYLLLKNAAYLYEASFLFWLWKGGGQAGFEDWKRIAVPPRLN
jgi:hypothetical protein